MTASYTMIEPNDSTQKLQRDFRLIGFILLILNSSSISAHCLWSKLKFQARENIVVLALTYKMIKYTDIYNFLKGNQHVQHNIDRENK